MSGVELIVEYQSLQTKGLHGHNENGTSLIFLRIYCYIASSEPLPFQIGSVV